VHYRENGENGSWSPPHPYYGAFDPQHLPYTIDKFGHSTSNSIIYAFQKSEPRGLFHVHKN